MGLNIANLGGNCPVQAEGTFDGVPFYFRARGQHWSLDVDPEDELGRFIGRPVMRTWEGSWGDDPYDAGWMTKAEALEIIDRCYAEWAADHKQENDS